MNLEDWMIFHRKYRSIPRIFTSKSHNSLIVQDFYSYFMHRQSEYDYCFELIPINHQSSHSNLGCFFFFLWKLRTFVLIICANWKCRMIFMGLKWRLCFSIAAVKRLTCDLLNAIEIRLLIQKPILPKMYV